MQEGEPIVKAAATLLSSAFVPSRIRFRSLITCALVVSLTTTCFVGATARASAQSGGSAGTIEGAVTDPSNAAVSGASAEIENSVTGYKRQTTTDEAGTFRFDNVPQNKYQLTVSAKGF